LTRAIVSTYVRHTLLKHFKDPVLAGPLLTGVFHLPEEK
jgi:hypothetical protein